MSIGLRQVTIICHTSGTLAISHLNIFAESVDDTVVRGDEVRRLQSGRSASRQYRCFGISTNNSDLLDPCFIDRKESVVIFEKNDGFCGGLSQKRGVFFVLVGAFLSIAIQDLPPMIKILFQEQEFLGLTSGASWAHF